MGIFSTLINTKFIRKQYKYQLNFTYFWRFESACNRLLKWICFVEVLCCNAPTLRSFFKWNLLWRRLDVMQPSNIGFSTLVSHEIVFALADQKSYHHLMADIFVCVTYGICFSQLQHKLTLLTENRSVHRQFQWSLILLFDEPKHSLLVNWCGHVTGLYLTSYKLVGISFV